MGNYVAATVLGGVGGRLIGGMLFPPDLWRWSFVFVAALIAIATLVAWRTLPDDTENRKPITANGSLADLLKSPNLLMLYACGGTGLALFATVFNYLPYRLTTAPFDLSSTVAAGFYTCYLLGLITAPMAGELSSRFGFGNTLLAGVVLVATALFALMSDELAVTIAALLLLSAGYFTLHSAAVGSLNSKLVAGQGRGRANALYIMFYYIGGSLGIQIGGYIYAWGGWTNLIVFCIVLLLVPLCAAIFEKRNG